MEVTVPKGVSKQRLAELYSAELALHYRVNAMTSSYKDCNLQEYGELLRSTLIDCLRVSEIAETLLNEVEQLISLEDN